MTFESLFKVIFSSFTIDAPGIGGSELFLTPFRGFVIGLNSKIISCHLMGFDPSVCFPCVEEVLNLFNNLKTFIFYNWRLMKYDPGRRHWRHQHQACSR
jgi:hypothetical protein